ncbi:MAG: type II toxin-antitoxin system VapC family toxin [Opitutales bacterium]|nr:type II toxin-antitoxin system VapC family toxin [Opitutales bacterium]
MIKYLLDTSVYCQRLRPKPHPEVVRRWRKWGDRALAIPAVAEAELLYGLEKKQSARLWQEYRSYLENRLVMIPVDKGVSLVFARIKANQERKGEPRADFDLFIAASAIERGLILATLNPRHFKDLDDLRMEDWS